MRGRQKKRAGATNLPRCEFHGERAKADLQDFFLSFSFVFYFPLLAETYEGDVGCFAFQLSSCILRPRSERAYSYADT